MQSRGRRVGNPIQEDDSHVSFFSKEDEKIPSLGIIIITGKKNVD